MASTIAPPSAQIPAAPTKPTLLPGLVLAGLGVLGAVTIHEIVGSLPLIVAAVLTGVVAGNVGLANADTSSGLAFASKTLLRGGIVLLGLRLSVGDIADLGFSTLAVIVVTVTSTFFAVQFIGRKLGLSPTLSLLVASGFSICGNSAIASVNGVITADDEEVAAAVGLVTLCGTAAIFVVSTIGAALGLTSMQLGVWTGAGVQDTAQVIAVASTAGPAVLAVATAVKLTRVLFLAPIVAGVSIWSQRHDQQRDDSHRPALLPLFVLGFLVAIILRTTGLVPEPALDAGRNVEHYLLAAGMVGLGTSVRIVNLRRLGLRPLLLGAMAWLIVGGVSLAALFIAGI